MIRYPRCRQTSTHLDWSSSRYVSRTTGIDHFYIYFLQVLTGETPFRGISRPALVYSVVHDKKCPDKPENAPDLGFSNSLWSLTQRCWDDEMGLRPGVGEVVKHLGEEAINWNGLMPPCAKAKDVVSDSEEMSDSMGYGELGILIFHQ